MGRRTWIDSSIWYETRKLTSSERDLYLRLVINDNGNSAGYYKLNLSHLAGDMSMDEDEVVSLLNHKTKFWKFDPETEQVLLPKYTKYNVVRGKMQEVRLNADLAQLSPSRLHKDFIEAWKECNGLGAELLLDHKFRDIADGYI